MKVDLTRVVGVCMGCEHWQVDCLPRALSEHGGLNPTVWALAEVHRVHVLDECPGGDSGRVLFEGQWVQRPLMADGDEASGVMAMQPLPRWWVWR